MTTPVRVALADDNTVIRRGVRALVEALPSLEFVGEAADGQAAVDLVRDQAPDVLLLDVRMPVRDGVSVVGEVAATTPVLMLTYSDEPEVIAAAIEAGASGYLVHGTFGDDEFESSVREVARGGFVLSHHAAGLLRHALAGRSAPPGAPQPPGSPAPVDAGAVVHGSASPVAQHLSERQREVMDAIARDGEKNGRVWACALLQLLEHNPELSLMFETLCANFKVRVVLQESRRLKERQLEGG